MNDAGFLPQDHELYEEVRGSGPLTEAIMETIGDYGVGSQAGLRSTIRAIASIEKRLAALEAI